ncbi:MAG: hypothetical protein HY665_02000 [Chloroflexi bacterium]|nr:hypothetical protein [Chloroflexota bacterium]
MKRGSRPRALSDRVKELITRRSLESTAPRGDLANELVEEIHSLGERAPKYETLIKRISKARNHETGPLEVTWHLGTVVDYPLNPDAIAKIFEWKTESIDGRFRNISIRTAQWISRLASLPLSVDMLYLYALLYSSSEQTSELSHTKFDTTRLDSELFQTLKKPDEAAWELNNGWGSTAGKRTWRLMTTFHLGQSLPTGNQSRLGDSQSRKKYSE